jgi:hypothetical protein
MFSHDQLTRLVPAGMPAAERLDDSGATFATTRLLEECITACEALAEQLGADPGVIWMQDLVAECIVACAGYHAATMRASRYTSRYALFAGELCGETAKACAPRADLASKFCEVLCRACENLVREESAAALAN